MAQETEDGSFRRWRKSAPPRVQTKHKAWLWTMNGFKDMKFLVKASGKDPQQKFTATNCWTKNFMRRKGLSVQKKTGKKHRPAAELLPRVKNFHWYSIYKMANENPWESFFSKRKQVFVNTTNIQFLLPLSKDISFAKYRYNSPFPPRYSVSPCPSRYYRVIVPL